MWKSLCKSGPTCIYIARELMLFCGKLGGWSVFESSYSLHWREDGGISESLMHEFQSLTQYA